MSVVDLWFSLLIEKVENIFIFVFLLLSSHSRIKKGVYRMDSPFKYRTFERGVRKSVVDS